MHRVPDWLLTAIIVFFMAFAVAGVVLRWVLQNMS